MENQKTWVSCLRRDFLGPLKVTTECPPPCNDCGDLPPKQQLRLLRTAYTRLIAEKRAVTISDGDATVSYDYSPATIALLRDEIKELRFLCADAGTMTTAAEVGEPTRPGFIRLNAGGGCW